jgi:hypothetical protein
MGGAEQAGGGLSSALNATSGQDRQIWQSLQSLQSLASLLTRRRQINKDAPQKAARPSYVSYLSDLSFMRSCVGPFGKQDI